MKVTSQRTVSQDTRSPNRDGQRYRQAKRGTKNAGQALTSPGSPKNFSDRQSQDEYAGSITLAMSNSDAQWELEKDFCDDVSPWSRSISQPAMHLDPRKFKKIVDHFE